MNAKRVKKIRQGLRQMVAAGLVLTDDTRLRAQQHNKTTGFLHPLSKKGAYKLAKKIGLLQALYVIDAIQQNVAREKAKAAEATVEEAVSDLTPAPVM